jgi:hypothetical protein
LGTLLALSGCSKQPPQLAQGWTPPVKVTDSAKDGIQTGEPQVAVQNGVIHLFYIQGKENPRLHVGNQGPWPVYYQQ